ncbi:phospholipase-like protein [Tanacetum coccineum]
MDKDAAAPIITIKANIDATVKEIRGALTDTQVQIFKKTCFGHWLDISLKRNNQLLIHTLLTCMVDSVANELSFLVSGKRIRFRRQDFCLVTGLRFGSNMYMKEWVKNMAENSFRNRIFPDIEARSVKLSDVIAIFDKMRDKSLVLEDNDAVYHLHTLLRIKSGVCTKPLWHTKGSITTNWANSVGHQDSLGAWGGLFWIVEVLRFQVTTGTFTPSGGIGGSTGGFRVQHTAQLDVTRTAYCPIGCHCWT